MKFHGDVPTGEDIAGEKVTGVAVERPDFPAVQSYRITVGPVESPQARPRIEQPQGESFEGLTVKFGRENIEIARALKDLPKILRRIKLFPLVTPCQGFPDSLRNLVRLA